MNTPTETATPDFLAEIVHERLISIDLNIDAIHAAVVAGDCLSAIRQLKALQELVTDTSGVTDTLCDMLTGI